MPRRVDPQQRRHEIARALWQVIAAHGLEDVSVRHVAAQAGVSAGRVQHWFRSKDEMLRFALDTAAEQVAERLTRRLTETQTAPPRQQVRSMLVEFLPLDEQRRLESHVALAFGARAAVSPQIAGSLRSGRAQMLDFLADRIRAGTADRVHDHTDHTDYAAIALTALVDGLAAHTLAGQCTPDDALATLDNHLKLLFDNRQRG